MPDVPEAVKDKGNESYGLDVTSGGVVIDAESDAGLFYGAQTLIQLLEQARREKAAVPGIAVVDWPTFPWRGRYFDGSQYLGTVVPTRANLEREIKLLARYKLNCLTFDAYNLVPFKSFPACADAHTLSLADWEYLVELAHHYHVAFFPSLQSFAQIYQMIWNCEEGKPYREETAPGLICPSRPENIVFLQGLYRDLISVFKYSPALGIGCSEVGMQWQKHYCARCRQRLEQGRNPSGYILPACPPLRPGSGGGGEGDGPNRAPDDVGGRILLRLRQPAMGRHREYSHQHADGPLAILEPLPEPGGSRRPGITTASPVCWSVVSTCSSFPPVLSSTRISTTFLPKSLRMANGRCYSIRAFTISPSRRAGPRRTIKRGCGEKYGAALARHSRSMTCVAGTRPGTPTLCRPSIAWGDPKRPLEAELDQFTDSFAATFYGARDSDTAQVIASAYRELDAVKSDLERNNYLIRDIIGEYDIHDASYVDNTLEASLGLIDELAAHPKGPGKTLGDIRRRCENALNVSASFRQKLAGAAAHVQNTYSLHYLVSAAHKMENHAQRTLFLLDMADAFQKPRRRKMPPLARPCIRGLLSCGNVARPSKRTLV